MMAAHLAATRVLPNHAMRRVDADVVLAAPGTYEYGCSIHAAMKAAVVVQ